MKIISLTKTWPAKLLAGLSILLAILIVGRQHGYLGVPQKNVPHSTGNPPAAAAVSPLPASAGNPSGVSKATAADHLRSALAALKGTTNPIETTKILADLRAYLDSLPTDLAGTVIRDFLADPALNASTHIDFAIGKNGFLDGHPSLRIALLDWLGQIDPHQALIVSQQILATSTDADEWAVSLRNYARTSTDSQSRDFLRTKTEDLIQNPAWRANPSIGFFQSFDVLVHTHSTESTGLLSDLVADTTPQGAAIAHAAFLTLDRLTFREPAIMMEQLAARQNLTQSRGEMVANMFARADLRDPGQQQLVRAYLLDPARTEAELDGFTGVYPNANFSISKNLLSENLTLNSTEIIARIEGARGIVDVWLADPAFAPVKSHLTTLQLRLTTLMRQSSSKQGGLNENQ